MAQIQDEENNDSDENIVTTLMKITHTMEITSQGKSKRFVDITDIPNITDHNDNNKPTEIYVDMNDKHYNTTIRRREKGLQLRAIDSPTKKHKPPENMNMNRLE